MNKLNADDIEHRFGFHKATIEGDNATLPRHAEIRKLFKDLATKLNELCPLSRAYSVGFTELETAAMWFHKAVAEEAPLVQDQL